MPHTHTKTSAFSDLGEVADDVRPLPVHLGEDVEDKGLYVEVQRLVVQEQLSEQTQVLTVELQPERGQNTSKLRLYRMKNNTLLLR